MRKYFLLSLLINVFIGSAYSKIDNSLRPFSSDGCTYSPDGWPHNPIKWQHCCVEHDLAYWVGGTKKDRKKADLALKSCIQKETDPVTAMAYYLVVRTGGSPLSKHSYRWGFGWEYNRGFKPLSMQESRQVKKKKSLLLEQDVIIEKLDYSSNPYPMESENYCLDFIDRFIELSELGKRESFKQVKKYYLRRPKRLIRRGPKQVEIRVKTDLCQEPVIFIFDHQDWKTCSRSYYSDSFPELSPIIKKSMNCHF